MSNLVDIYAALQGRAPAAAAADFAGMDTLQFKEHVASAVVAAVDPIRVGACRSRVSAHHTRGKRPTDPPAGRQGELARLQGEPAFVDAVLRRGAAQAGAMAEATMVQVRHSVGLAPRVA